MSDIQVNPSPNGDTVKARLKWFNAPKGFGFVIPENEATDAFLHVTTLKRAGIERIGEGASLLCLIERGPRGAQVQEIVTVLDAGHETDSLAPDAPLRCDDALQLSGMVKWYVPEKGYGFVTAADGQQDIFLHRNRLQRHGLTTIAPRTRLRMAVRMTSRGREAVDFEFLDD